MNWHFLHRGNRWEIENSEPEPATPQQQHPWWFPPTSTPSPVSAVPLISPLPHFENRSPPVPLPKNCYLRDRDSAISTPQMVTTLQRDQVHWVARTPGRTFSAASQGLITRKLESGRPGPTTEQGFLHKIPFSRLEHFTRIYYAALRPTTGGLYGPETRLPTLRTVSWVRLPDSHPQCVWWCHFWKKLSSENVSYLVSTNVYKSLWIWYLGLL